MRRDGDWRGRRMAGQTLLSCNPEKKIARPRRMWCNIFSVLFIWVKTGLKLENVDVYYFFLHSHTILEYLHLYF